MIENFFHSLNDHAVESLLISGQASVLYGAATFSEDIDLWINPTSDNRSRFLAALTQCHARYYKLTPPFEVEYLLRGHGFHFTLPSKTEPDAFLDVMGKPPRVGSFESVRATANWMDTDWGRVLTIGIKELVELKKTRRLEDYPIIGRLALAWYEQPQSKATVQDHTWAIENIFTLGELRRFFEEYQDAVSVIPGEAPVEVAEFALCAQDGRDPPERIEIKVTDWMQRRIQHLQQADRGYWRGIIEELRHLRAESQLVPDGAPVSV